MARASNVLRWPGGGESGDEPTDAFLVERWRTGDDRDAVAKTLYLRHASRIYGLFRRLDLPLEISQELTQEVFCKAFEKLGDFRGESAFGTWLQQIARNQARRFFRDRAAQKRAGHHVPIEEQVGEQDETMSPAFVEDTQDGPEPRLIASERLMRLRRAIAQLPPQRRQLLRLRLDQQRSDKEIARLLEIPIGTVKSRMSDTRRALKKALAEDYPSLRSGS